MGASLFGTGLNILVVGGVWAILGVVVVKLNTYANTLALSADAMNTIYFLEVAYGVAGLLYLIAVILNHWIVEKNAANQGV
jgi:ABC-type sulfate transport system permease subunit